ncbi:MAG TPA: sulfurtransferase complex subunit TusB [Usitatibacter sp.]|nr:sulfurtransferase complex subunit TusB [Usitatibacter sp.]
MLHIVNKSPTERPALESCLAHARPGDSVLLIEDGVYAATRGSAGARRLESLPPDVKVYALAPDLEARAMDGALVEGVMTVDYRGFVDLVARHSRVQSWL